VDSHVPKKVVAASASEWTRFDPLSTALDRRAGLHLMPSMSIAAGTEHERAAYAHQLTIYRAMTPQKRLQQALRMNRTMRALLAAGFRQRQPTWTEAEVRRAVADRILHARTG
jgi:hypothetical protein